MEFFYEINIIKSFLLFFQNKVPLQKSLKYIDNQIGTDQNLSENNIVHKFLTENTKTLAMDAATASELEALGSLQIKA